MYRCPVCSSTDIEIIVDRKNVLVHQNLQFNSEKAAKDAKTGNLKMQLCHDCGFVFNSEFNPKLISYCEEYDNRQTCSPAFHSYIADLAHKVATHGKKAETKVVEVGCGNGEFINLILSLNNFSNKWIGYGFDPSYQGPLESLDGRLQFVQSYYDQEASSIDADLVCCRHVIEHVPDPVSMVASVRKIGRAHV